MPAHAIIAHTTQPLESARAHTRAPSQSGFSSTRRIMSNSRSSCKLCIMPAQQTQQHPCPCPPKRRQSSRPFRTRAPHWQRPPQRAPQRLSSSLIISSCSMRPSCHGASRGAAGAKSFQANPSFSQSRGWDRRRAAQTGRAAVPNPPDRSCRALRARGLRAPPRLIRRR